MEDDLDDDLENLFEIEEMEAGDEFMATKPWLGAMVAPTNFDEELNIKE